MVFFSNYNIRDSKHSNSLGSYKLAQAHQVRRSINTSTGPMDSPTLTETSSCSPTGEEQDPNSIWHNFLVNLSPKSRRASGTYIGPLCQTKQKQATLSHFAVPPSGDIFEPKNRNDQREDGDSRKWDSGEDCEWYQFDEHDLLEPAAQEVNAADWRDLGTSGHEHLEVHALSTSRRGVETQFRKSWGNFTNIFDEQGRQKSCIWRSELSNYIELRNIASNTKDDPQTEVTFLASLFTGNYPKPLFRSTWSWRMRWNVFVVDVDEQVLVELEGLAETTKDETVGRIGRRRNERGDAKVLHLGEMHLYLHVERGHEWPVYQNLCFFFDPGLVAFVKSAPESKGAVAMEAVATQLKMQLSKAEFVSQLYFPVEKTRFSAVDQSVQFFELRQRDLQAAITIANEQVPFAFLHRAPTVPKQANGPCAPIKSPFSGSSRHSNSSRLSWSASNPSLATAISPMSSGTSWRRRNSWDD